MSIKILIFIIFSFVIVAIISKNEEDCNFLSSIKSQSEIDTIMVSGFKIASIKIHYSDQLKELDKEKKLHLKDFSYTVDFIPQGCSTRQFAECKDTSDFVFNITSENYHKPVHFRCIVFRKIFKDSLHKKPYYIIDSIAAK